MKSKMMVFICLNFFLFSVSHVFGQKTLDSTKVGQRVIVKMYNGDEFKGEILKRSDSIIIIKTTNGELNLLAFNVSKIEIDNYNGSFKFANVYDTRYFFGPSGFQLKKNKGYYQNLLLTSNLVHYGITNNISIGGGFEFASLIAGQPIWYITPKIGFEISKNVHAAGGIFLAGVTNEGSAALGYGVITLGSSESNITLGTGFGYLSGEVSKNPAIMVSGTTRVSNGLALLSENYFIPNSRSDFNYLGIQGIRLLFPKNSFDFGLILVPQTSSSIIPIPFIGFSKHF